MVHTTWPCFLILSPGNVQDWPEGGDDEELKHKAAPHQRPELGQRLGQPEGCEGAAEGFQDILQLRVVVAEGELVELGIVAIDLEEGEETPHQVVAEGS